MVSTLTKNAIDKMVNNSNDPNEEYIIQVLVAPIFVADQLFKFTFSDGFARSKKGYLVSEAASKAEEIKEMSIIKVRKFINPEQNVDKERIIVATFELLYTNVTELIGKSMEYKNYKNNGMQNPEGSIVIPDKYINRNANQAQKNVTGSRQTPNQFGQQNQNGSIKSTSNNAYGHNKVTQNPQNIQSGQSQKGLVGGMPSAKLEDEKDLERISSLSPNQQDASFKARVTKKGEMKNFKSARGEGTLFSIDAIDAYGSEISMSFFNAESNKFFSYIQVGQVYIFKNGIIKPNTNPKFNKGEVTVTIGRDTVIMAATDDGRIPFVSINRVLIDEIQSKEKDSTLDIIGFIRESTESKTITLRDQTQKSKRDIKVFDESRTEIEITLWGEKAESLNAKEGDLIVFKDAKIGEYNQKKQINVGYNTQIILNPELSTFPEAYPLIQWRDNNDLTSLLEEFKNKQPSYNDGGEGNNEVNITSLESSISQLKEEINLAKVNQMFNENFKIWKEVRAVIHIIFDSPLYYDSCDKCKKKVKPNADKWLCENCQVEYDEPVSRYIMNAKIADTSDECTVSIYDEVAKKIMGFSANEFRYIGENPEERKKKLQLAYNKEFRLLLLTKCERDPNSYQFKEKIIAHAIKDDQPAKESKRILNALEKYLE